jgi:hypothetical protein
VLLRAFTPAQMMKNKIGAAIERKAIKDCFDIEFLLRRGVPLIADKDDFENLGKVIAGFRENDYKVTLGAVLEPAAREYYIGNRFSYIEQKLKEVVSF